MKENIFENITDYVIKELNNFNKKQFNQVDSLVLSNLCYLNLNELVPGIKKLKKSIKIKDILKAEYFEKMLRNVRMPKEYIRFIYAICASPRFREVEMCCYVDKIDTVLEKQFSATTFILNKELAYIGFRGTDATLIGWKEDFNMSFKFPVSSQLDAKEYLDSVYRIIKNKKIYLGGHSKGGNLAVYALTMCSKKIQEKIVCVFSHDGPGFKEGFLDSKEFKKVKEKVNKTVPQSSIIGMVLQVQENFNIVKSNNVLIMQHEPFSWEIVDGDFKYVEQLSDSSKYINKSLSTWLEQMTDEKRELFVYNLFDILMTNNSETVYELFENWKKNLPTMLDKIKNLDSETKEVMMQLLKEFSKETVSNLSIKLPQNPFSKLIKKY